MADSSGYFLPKFFNDSQDDPLMYDADLGILAVVNNMPEGFISTTQVPDEINRCCGVDGVNRPRPGHDLIATIANCTRVNGIVHFQKHVFIIAATVSGVAKWYSLNGTTLTDISTGAPLFNVNTNVIMDQGLSAVYVCWGGAGLYKWNGISWSTISIGTSQSTGAPVIPATVDYFAGSVTVTEAASNVMYFSGLLADTTWDPVNLSVQLDQFLQDSITGMSAWQGFNLIVFKNTSVWSVGSNPTLILTSPAVSRANEPVNRISNTIGCCNHRTIAQIDNDILFLSESGRGVYSVGQIATNQQQAIKNNISLDTVAGNIGSGTVYASQITTRGYRFDQETNLIQPYNIVLELVNTLVPVTVQILADDNLVGSTHTVTAQSVAGSVLPVILPFVLAGAGVNKGAVTARDAGICSQVQ